MGIGMPPIGCPGIVILTAGGAAPGAGCRRAGVPAFGRSRLAIFSTFSSNPSGSGNFGSLSYCRRLSTTMPPKSPRFVFGPISRQ